MSLGSLVALALALSLLLNGQGVALERSAGWPVALATPVPSPRTEIVARGLIKPRGLAFGPEGSLYVAEAGTGGEQLVDLGGQKPHAIGRTGRISRILPSGDRTTVTDGLPSIVAAFNEELGPTGLAFLGDQLYLLTASGGWELADAEFHNGIFRVLASGALERIFDYSNYTREHPPRSRLEDPRADVPLGMPYGLAALEGRLFTTDGNQEQVLAVTPSGEATRIADYPRSNRALTGITAGPDGALYVAELAAMKVTRITTDGQISDAATKLQSPIGVAFDRLGQLHALEYYSGRVVLASAVGEGSHEVLATGLRAPTAMTFGPDQNLYISTGGSAVGDRPNRDGQVVRLLLAPTQPPQANHGPNTLLPWLGGLALFALAVGAAFGVRGRWSLSTRVG